MNRWQFLGIQYVCDYGAIEEKMDKCTTTGCVYELTSAKENESLRMSRSQSQCGVECFLCYLVGLNLEEMRLKTRIRILIKQEVYKTYKTYQLSVLIWTVKCWYDFLLLLDELLCVLFHPELSISSCQIEIISQFLPNFQPLQPSD